MSEVLKRIDAALAAAGLSRQAAAKKAGVNPDAIRDIDRKDSSPRLKTIEALASVLNRSPAWLAFGEGGELAPVAQPKNVPVRGTVAAGMWFDDGYIDEGAFDDVPAVTTRFRALEQTAWRVSGDSMNEEGIVEGSFAITVEYWQVREAIQDKDIVVVERREGGKIERTIKKVSIMPNEIRLMACSTNPQWRGTYIAIPRGGNRDGSDGTSIEVVGLVVGTYRPMS